MIAKNTLTSKKEAILHLCFWLLYAYFALIDFDRTSIGYFQIEEISLFSFTWIMVFAVTFYFNYLFVLPRVFHPFKWEKALLGLIAVALIFVAFRFFIEQVLTVLLFGKQNYFQQTGFIYYIYDNLFYSSKPIILSTIFWLLVFLIRLLEYNKHIIEEQKITEVKFLKAQINPHFIFNTLNNIYSMVYFQSEQALPAIEKLSQMMRFTTYDFAKEKISLEKELNYIEAYIELEELRHEDGKIVEFKIDTEGKEFKIPPYLLSPLVENAFKHGVTSSNKQIKFCLEIKDGNLKFEIQNEIAKKKKDKLGGIGLDNLKNRLEIYYPKKHLLELTNKDGIFTAVLKIQLK